MPCGAWAVALLLCCSTVGAQQCYEPSQDEASEVLTQDAAPKNGVVIRACFASVIAREPVARVVGRTTYTVREPTADASRGIAVFRDFRCVRAADAPLHCERSGGVARLQAGELIRISDRIGSREIAEVVALMRKLYAGSQSVYAVYAADAPSNWDAPSEFNVITRPESLPDAEEYCEHGLKRVCRTSSDCAWQVNGPRPHFPAIP